MLPTESILGPTFWQTTKFVVQKNYYWSFLFLVKNSSTSVSMKFEALFLTKLHIYFIFDSITM